jgi:hypothetical protein
VDRNFYSVPSTLIGQSLDVRVTSHTIEVFAGAERVACHTRLRGVRGRYSILTEHMAAGHRHRLVDWTPQRFEQWAATIGPDTVAAIQAILASRKIAGQSYRSCLGVMSLARKPGGMVRLEDSCGRALAATPSPSCTLIKKLWAAWQPADPPPGDGYRDSSSAESSAPRHRRPRAYPLDLSSGLLRPQARQPARRHLARMPEDPGQ